MQIIEIQLGAAPNIIVPDKFACDGHINRVLNVCSDYHDLFAGHGGPVIRSEVILAAELTRRAHVAPKLINTINAILAVRGIKAAAIDVTRARAHELAEYVMALPSEG